MNSIRMPFFEPLAPPKVVQRFTAAVAEKIREKKAARLAASLNFSLIDCGGNGWAVEVADCPGARWPISGTVELSTIENFLKNYEKERWN